MFSNSFLCLVVLFCAGSLQNIGSNATFVRKDIKGRLLTPAEGCGYTKVPNTRIVGGSAAKVGAWPWLALLGVQTKYGAFFACGGSLITTRHVLTAAHCLRAGFEIVRLGEHDTTTETDGKHIDIPIARAKKHEDYNLYTRINDIATLLLAHDVTFTDRISPICLPTSKNTFNFADSNPFVAGWGHQEESGSEMSTILQQVQVPVVPSSECRKKFEDAGEFEYGRDHRFNATYVVCAGFTEGGKDACQGDSGGPLMLPVYENGRFPFYQIGIVAYGKGCGRPNLPTIYTNVQHYYDWIGLD